MLLFEDRVRKWNQVTSVKMARGLPPSGGDLARGLGHYVTQYLDCTGDPQAESSGPAPFVHATQDIPGFQSIQMLLPFAGGRIVLSLSRDPVRGDAPCLMSPMGRAVWRAGSRPHARSGLGPGGGPGTSCC